MVAAVSLDPDHAIGVERYSVPLVQGIRFTSPCEAFPWEDEIKGYIGKLYILFLVPLYLSLSLYSSHVIDGDWGGWRGRQGF